MQFPVHCIFTMEKTFPRHVHVVAAIIINVFIPYRIILSSTMNALVMLPMWKIPNVSLTLLRDRFVKMKS